MKMNITFFLFVFFTYSYCSFCYYEVVESIRTDDEASILLTIKASIIDPLDNLRDWKLPENGVANATVHCSWSGVECNSIGTVEKLHLSDMNLSGRVHDSIQRLKALVSIDLSCNSFDRFPVGLGMASRLISLNASDNNFFGYLPEDLGNATSLESLDLRGNFFKGNIPTVYKNLRRLRHLDLAGNNLRGRIPAELGELSSLETIILGYNELEGGIPREIGNLTNLEYIDLAVANLGGSIPAEIGKLKRLDTLLLYKNDLEGKIPSEIGNMTSLKCLDVSNNMLSDEIPARVADLKNLKLLKLMENQLSGTVPASIGRLTQLEVLELWKNKLSGPLPSNLGQYSPLQLLDISSNSFSGQIPTTLCSKGNLTKLILFNNAFSGPIPSSLSTCSSLVRVRMQNNNLSGTIPVGFGKLSNLQRLDLANNSLTGQIPSDLSTSTSLSFIDFSRNRLESSLYSSILSIPSLQNFNISGNNLVGNIPDQFQDCPALAVLDLSSNHFTGSIPSSIAKCKKLVTLNLQNNQLNGPIPSRIAMIPTLAVLDLSNNSLTGEIPENFGNSPALEILDVSYNRLVGPVPSNGMLRTIHLNDLVGNSGLCGGVLPPCSQNAAYMLRQQGLRAEQVIWGWIIGISTLLTVIIAWIGARSLYQIWKNGNFFKERFKSSNGEQPWRLMAFQRLGFNRTDILSCVKESNAIGMGATGTVYKAEIQRLNTTVAVKKLWRSTSDLEMVQSNELVGEVNLLGILRHRNIVRLLGFLHNESDAMIIYEYMQNGSLGEALHGKKGGNLLVDWVSRYNIALGIAQGLAYLHHDCDPPVIHRDVKPNNILLDANLEARIADFGLAKTMLEKNETVSVVAGSYGYIAPEYGYTLKVDEKSDVYSYGVVLMELLTGKKPLEVEFGESVDIVEWIQSKIRKNQSLEEVLDPSIGNTKHVQEEMLLVLGIAILCTAKLPKDRPSMRDVISMLGEAKPQRKSNNGGQTSI